MSYSQEAIGGAVGIVLGAAVPPNTEWYIELRDVWVFLWPLISGCLWGIGAHIVTKIIERKTKKKQHK